MVFLVGNGVTDFRVSIFNHGSHGFSRMGKNWGNGVVEYWSSGVMGELGAEDGAEFAGEGE